MTREEHIQRYGCCATCISWVVTRGGIGECWSGDRLEDDWSSGSAGVTFAYDLCEAHCPRAADPQMLAILSKAKSQTHPVEGN
jgi:hypothetical protein